MNKPCRNFKSYINQINEIYEVKEFEGFKMRISEYYEDPDIKSSWKIKSIRQLIPRLYKYHEKCYNTPKVQRSPRKPRDTVEQDGS